MRRLVAAILNALQACERLTAARLPKVLWWMVLVTFLSILAFRRRALLLGTPIGPFDTGLLVVWVLVLLAPVYSEVDLLGVRVKREVAELKERVAGLQASLHAQAVATSNISLQTPLPPPDPALADLAKEIRSLVNTLVPGTTTTAPPVEFEAPLSDDIQLLFSARLSMEKELRRLAGLYVGAEEANRAPVGRLTQRLAGEGVLDGRLASAVREAYAVCSTAVHGQTVSREQVSFIREVVPGLLRALRSAGPRATTTWTESR
jgi:hypothetical protein